MTAAASKCKLLEDTAGYWNPNAELSGTRLPGKRASIYYAGTPNIQVKSFPPGLQMIAGNKNATSRTDNPHVTWFCATNASPLVDHPYDCSPYDTTTGVTAFVEFPNCWNGTTTAWDSTNPPVRYPDSNGNCSNASFPKTLPRITYRVHFGIVDPCDGATPCTPDNASDSNIKLSLSSGPYYTMHADFWNTWNQAKLDDLVASCLNVHVDCGKVESSPTIPNAGTLSATGTDGAVNLSWTVPSLPGGSAITNYAIYRSTENAAETDTAPTVPLTTVGNVTSYSDTSATPGTLYYYRVAAINAKGEGMLSNQASGTATGVPTAPAAPTLSASAHPGSSSQIDLSWTDVANETSYRVERSNALLGWDPLATLGQNVTTYSDTGLSPNTSYTYRVVAINTVGETPSNPATATTNPAAPAQPSGVTATAASSTEIDLTWDPSTTGATGYKVQRSPDGTSGWTQIATPTAASYSDVGLSANTTYYYRVIATNAGGDSAPSDPPASATTFGDTTAPTAPTNLVAKGVKAKVSLSWTASTDAGGSGLAGYEIWRSTTGASGAFSLLNKTTGTSYTDSAVSRGRTYTYYVVAFDGAGNRSSSSNTASASPR
jgi:fibronectin type 3 domain-containing protein